MIIMATNAKRGSLTDSSTSEETNSTEMEYLEVVPRTKEVRNKKIISLTSLSQSKKENSIHIAIN